VIDRFGSDTDGRRTATLRQSLSQSTRRKAAVYEILSASVVPQIHDISP